MASLFSRFSIKTKIIASFALILSLTVAVSLFMIQRVSGLHATVEILSTSSVPSLAGAAELRSLVQQFRLKETRYILTPDPAERKQVEATMNDVSAAYSRGRKNYNSLLDAGEETELFARIDKIWAEYLAIHDRLLAVLESNGAEAATALFRGQAGDVFWHLDDLFNQDINYNLNHVTDGSDQERGYYQNSLVVMQASILIATLVTLVVGFGLVRGISVPITRMTSAMRRLADHDLSAVVPGVGRGDEIGGMAAAVQVFKDNIVRADGLTAAEETSKRAAAQRAESRAWTRRRTRSRPRSAAWSRPWPPPRPSWRPRRSRCPPPRRRPTSRLSTVAAAAEEASAGVQTVAAAAEELTSSIREISRQVAQSAAVSREGGQRRPPHRHHRPTPGRRRAEDRPGGGPDQQHRRADQPSGAQRNDRGGARRRRRQGLRRGRQRSQGAGHADRQGDRARSAPRSSRSSPPPPRPSRPSGPSA